MNAKTIEEVLQFETEVNLAVKLAFKKMSMLVHPDKNLHPNANEACKIVNDAYKKLCDGENPRTGSLKIPNLPTESNKKPPKVKVRNE